MPEMRPEQVYVRRLIGLCLALAVALAGCAAKKKPPLGAAEPAVAPPATTAPAGIIAKVGGGPEGLVYDPVSKLVAVAVRNPDRLVLLRGDTLALVKTVPLKGHARHLQLARPGGPVLVPEEDANLLALVSLPDGATTEIKTGQSPHDASAVAGGFVAGDEFGKSITIARTGAPEQTVHGPTQPGGVVGYGDTVAIVDVGSFTVSTFRVSDGARIAVLAAGAGPTHGVKTSDGQLVVIDTRGNALLSYTESPLHREKKLKVPGTPYGVTADPDGPLIWVTLTARNEVVGYTVGSGGRLTETARLSTVAQPDSVAVEPGSHTVFITGTNSGVVQRLTR